MSSIIDVNNSPRTERCLIRFEGVANVLGLIPGTSPASGTIRIMEGLVHITVAASKGVFHWIAACWQIDHDLMEYHFDQSDYCRGQTLHGLGNIARGVFEIATPFGNYVVIGYTLLGFRMRYASEENRSLTNNLTVLTPAAIR